MNKVSNFNEIFNGIEYIFNEKNINLEEFNKYLQPTVHKAIGQYLLDSISQKHDFVPTFNPVLPSRTILYQTPKMNLELEVLPVNTPSRKFVSKTRCKQAVGVLIGNVKIQRFSPPNDKKEISLLSEEFISNGNSVSIDNEYVVIESSSTTNSTYLLYLSDRTSIQKEATSEVYSTRTGKFSHIVSNSLTSSRLELMLFVMGHMHYQGCSDVVKNLAFQHDDYFIRWEAARTFCKVNPDEAEVFLAKILENEKHPHVLNAIKKSLQLIENRNQ